MGCIPVSPKNQAKKERFKKEAMEYFRSFEFDPGGFENYVLAPADHAEETPTAGEILLVKLQMAGHFRNAGRQDRNLDLRRPGVASRTAKFLDQLALTFFRD